MGIANYTELYEAVYSHLYAQWRDGDGALLTPIQRGNESFVPKSKGSYLRIHIREGTTGIYGFGSPPIYQHRGEVELDLLVPYGTGKSQVLRLADKIYEVMGSRFIGDVEMTRVREIESGTFSDDLAYEITTIGIEYRYQRRS